MTDFRIYIETTVIADWLLIEASTKHQRKRLTEKVVSSHKLVNFLLHQSNDQIQSFTSDWALFEAVDVIKRGYIEIRMVGDGISTRFYSDLKDSEEYRLEDTFVVKVNKLIGRLTTKDKKITSPLILFGETADIDIGIPLILKNRLESAVFIAELSNNIVLFEKLGVPEHLLILLYNGLNVFDANSSK